MQRLWLKLATTTNPNVTVQQGEFDCWQQERFEIPVFYDLNQHASLGLPVPEDGCVGIFCLSYEQFHVLGVELTGDAAVYRRDTSENVYWFAKPGQRACVVLCSIGYTLTVEAF